MNKVISFIKQAFQWIGRQITGFFYYLSNTDPELIQRCSFWAKAKGVLIGVMILLSSCLAGLSMIYFVKEATGEIAPAIVFSVLWTMTVMHIEKSVYLAVSKWAVLVRIAMILVISFLVSLPLKIRLFDDALTDQVKKMQHDEKVANYEGVADQEAKNSGVIQRLINDLNGLRDEKLRGIRKRDAEKDGLALYSNASGLSGKGGKYDALNAQVKEIEKAIRTKEQQIGEAKVLNAEKSTKAEKLYHVKNEGISEDSVCESVSFNSFK